MCEVYKLFAQDWEQCCDFSEEMKLELFYSESYGDPVSDRNGYYVGKRWLNVNVAMWLEDIQKGYLHKSELYDDEKIPNWWLDKILK